MKKGISFFSSLKYASWENLFLGFIFSVLASI